MDGHVAALLAMTNRVHRLLHPTARPRFRFSRPVQAEIIALFDLAWHTPAASHAPPLPDPHDEPFLAVALATPDRVLVTGNIKHFPPPCRAGVTVLTPREALARIT